MFRKTISILLVLGMAICLLPLGTFAEDYDISVGSIEVKTNEAGERKVTQANNPNAQDHTEQTDTRIYGNADTAVKNTITLDAAKGTEIKVTLDNVNIDVSSKGGTAAISVKGEGNSTIELDGANTAISGNGKAGVNKVPEQDPKETGKLTIKDDNGDGSLTAKGGPKAAGIGGQSGYDTANIEIAGGTINAYGGTSNPHSGAGIGGGSHGGDASNITISGGTVYAEGGPNAAGIGGGSMGSGSNAGNANNIVISGENTMVTAKGASNGAGIGGGANGGAYGITITGGTVIAYSVKDGAGIGGGFAGNGGAANVNEGDNNGITISGGTVVATGGSFDAKGGNGGAGIGGGMLGNGTNITITDANVTAMGGNAGGAGIGGGAGRTKEDNAGTGTDITISGTASVIAVGGPAAADGKTQAGAAIGNGGAVNKAGSEATDLHTDKLAGGTITTYEPGTTPAQINDPTNPAKPTSTEHTHLAGETKKENSVAATCTQDGSYDLVTYCATCGEAIKTEHVTVDMLGHTPGKTVVENRVEATDSAEGGYDEVVYCTVCGEELSRKHVVLPVTETESPFDRFCLATIYSIRTAPADGTVEVNAQKFPGFTRNVLDALAKRPDVALNVRCTIDGQATELTIPAGTDLLSAMSGKGILTFGEIAELVK